MFDQLSSLDTSRTTWRVKVRVTRMWPSISNSSNGNEGLKGYNMILLDDDNCHVHAYVYADTWKMIADKMVEGGLYIISNFYTKEALGTLKPVSSKVLINFSPSTTVEKIVEDDFMIPMHKFEFVDLADLFNIAISNGNSDTPDFSTDVIGVLEDFDNVSILKTMYGERNIARFRITDGRHSHKVSVWGQLAINIDAEYKKISERPIIIILSSTKLKTFRNTVQISTLPSSKVYLNLDNDVVGEMRQRLDEEGYIVPQRLLQSPTQHVNNPAPLLETLTLKELSEKTSTDCLERYFLCKVTIKVVEQSELWWFLSCIGCGAETSKEEGKIKCSGCTKNYPVSEKRYRVLILAEDDTEAYNFILLDRAAKRLIGQTATKLIANMIETSNEEFPTQIKQLSGKEVTLKIQIRHDNILLNSTIFYATDAFEGAITNSQMYVATTSGSASSVFSESAFVDLSESENTPISAKSCSKRVKMEK